MLRPAHPCENHWLLPSFSAMLRYNGLVLGYCLLTLGASALNGAELPATNPGGLAVDAVSPVVMDSANLPQTPETTAPLGVEVGQVNRAEPVSATPAVAARLLAEELCPGSLILHQGDCLAVKIYTKSRFTHVGVLLPDEAGEWQVYDSANGHGVRKMSLGDYLQIQPEQNLVVYHPAHPLNASELRRLQTALEEPLGRPYSVKHFLSGEPTVGLHCSEYACCALMAIPLITADRPARVSPVSLLNGLAEADLYRAGISIQLLSEPPTPPLESQSWCGRLWISTKNCTGGWWNRCFRAVTCRE